MIMKRFTFIATALIALASCSDSEFVGENTSQTSQTEQGAIVFGTGVNTVTRADHVGADAADLLGKKFIVGGFKNDGTSYSTVFDHYQVNWEENTAGTTTDNTSDWKYVGVTTPELGTVNSGAQTIKYWDYAASYYDFVAFSAGKENALIYDGTPTTGTNVLATAVNTSTLTTAAYTLKGNANDLAKCYIADLVTAKKNGTSPDQKYQDEIKFKFRSLGAKVRIALYETVPGYSVQNVKFYSNATTTIESGTENESATLFTSDAVFYPDGTMTVKFPTIGASNTSDTDYNKAHVSFVGTGTAADTKSFGNLNYTTDKEDTRIGDGNYLQRTSSTPSFAGTTAPYYLTVLPDENGNVLTLRVDYELKAIDGTNEVIKVHGATAYVPQIYAAWKPNYAYTYIFKISDNTNGWTSKVDTDPTGLYPITFDAIVLDSEEKTQSTITTVASPSITTYQVGHVYTDNEYKAGKIYVQVMANGSLKNDLGAKAKLYTITNISGNNTAKLEANVMDALNIKVSEIENVITGRNGLVLTRVSLNNTTTIPGVDGNDITVNNYEAQYFTAESNKTYAYVYEVSDGTPSYYYSAEASTTKPTDWTTGTWYKDPDGLTAVADADWESEKIFYKKYTNQNKIYGVKVIKVAAGS